MADKKENMPDAIRERVEELKKKVFYEILDIIGRVFVVVRYSDEVMIGSRGFLPEEKESGLVLVFNRRMNFAWPGDAIECTLVFGTSPQQCYIPSAHIVAISSPELSTQLIVAPSPADAKQKIADEQSAHQPSVEEQGGNVVQVDFKRKKR
ncbi:MAG: hypothetical protein HZA20_01665 [Nitrospirae bacterium]|nr:hypothetical protein [Nitrospirota bacterium]